MTVGESLSEARYQAGLSVDELSERTRIRDSVIRSIERDDYEACGGDLYVRGYVRTIAGAVGIDAQPLIQEFDQERVHAANDASYPDEVGRASDADEVGRASGARPYVPLAAVSADPSGAPGGDPDATSMDLPAVPSESASAGGGQDPDETRFDLPAVLDDPTETRFDLPPVRADHTEDMMAAGYDLQPEASRPASATPPGGWDVSAADGWATPVARAEAPAAAPRTRRRERRGGRVLAGVAAVAVLAIVVVVGVRLTSSTTPTARNAANSTPARSASPTATGTSAATAKASAAATQPAVQPTKTASAPKPPARPPVTALPVAAAYAFGPGGLGDGDNPQGALYAISRNSPLPWSTNWYASAQFGLLKHGTGLLLSLGRQDTITSVLVGLTQFRGVDLQLKVGDGTAPQDFRVAATADNTGGTVRLTFRHPASARYLLIWFTQLPPNGVGQYQESVYHVLVNGRR